MKTLTQIKNVIKKYVKPQYQAQVLEELFKLKKLWDNLSSTKYTFTEREKVDFFFDNDSTGLFNNEDLFTEEVNDDEGDIFLDWFIRFVVE